MPLLDKTLLLTCNIRLSIPSGFTTSIRNYAARKGTRDRRAKAKVKQEIQKVGFIPHNQRNLEKFLATRPKMKFDDSWKQKPLDNVYPHKYYQWDVHAFEDAVRCIQELNHPEMLNRPNENVHVNIELNMETERKTKFLDNFQRIASIPHSFEHGEERSIVAFAKNEIKQKAARAAGASLAGGVELIKDVQNGVLSLSDFQFYVAEPAILPELVILRGIMKKRFPSIRMGTLSEDVVEIVSRLSSGIHYQAVRDEYEKDFGLIQAVLGTLTMDPKQLEENFAALVKDVMLMKSKRDGPFISRCLLWSPPYAEKLKVDHYLYLDTQTKDQNSQNEQEIEESDETVESNVQQVSS